MVSYGMQGLQGKQTREDVCCLCDIKHSIGGSGHMLHAGQISEWVLCGPQSVVYNNMGKARKFWTELADELFLNLSVFKHKPEF